MVTLLLKMIDGAPFLLRSPPSGLPAIARTRTVLTGTVGIAWLRQEPLLCRKTTSKKAVAMLCCLREAVS